ncbi:Myc-type, basic helix-loop-helix (bHLH) domain [Dillenia turbinata]|uniref:Myc-type, basic helix-loop-helix (BHLH) domain n=1 Tax=Dillenia turbinata TaxID=194707 RepID=A0AAN8YXJ9_9MAGN
MISEARTSSVDNNSRSVAEKQGSRSPPPAGKKCVKVPKKIHKAEREKLKRDQLNELFSELGNALEPSQQSNGKACILTDAARLLRDLIAQVDCLKRENMTLLSESHYMIAEKDELREEQSALKAQIEELQRELDEKTRTTATWDGHLQSETSSNSDRQEESLVLPSAEGVPQQFPSLGPVYVLPFPPGLQAYHTPETMGFISKIPSNVSKPHARYPSSSDTWQAQIFGEHPSTT